MTLTPDDFTPVDQQKPETKPQVMLEGEYFSKEEVIQHMLSSLDAFGTVLVPEEVTAEFADIHYNTWDLLTTAVLKEEGLDKYAIGIPRGHAKSFLLKLLCVFIILFSKRNYILIVCATATLAENFVADVCSILDGDNCRRLFGDWRADVTNDKESLKKFHFRGRNITIVPRGKGGAIRGTNIDMKRPDVIINDDIQTIEESRSEDQSLQLLQWFLGTLLKARSPRRCTIVFLGNMYPDVPLGERQLDESKQLYTCLLRNLQRNPEWMTWVTGGILADGTALWEAVHSKEALLSDLRQDTALGQQEIWFAEIQNDPAAVSGKWLDPSKIPEYPYNEFDLVIGKFLVIDPSLGKKKSDDQIVALFYVYDDKGPVLREVRNIQKSAPDLVKEVLEWCLEERIPLVAAESVAYQATLLQWFAFFVSKLGIEGINFVGVTPRGMSKPSRILAYFKGLMAGRTWLHEDAKPLVLAQAQLYQPQKSDNIDDILDTGAYGEDVFVQYSTEYLLPLEWTEDTHRPDHDKLPDNSNDMYNLEYNPHEYY